MSRENGGYQKGFKKYPKNVETQEFTAAAYVECVILASYLLASFGRVDQARLKRVLDLKDRQQSCA